MSCILILVSVYEVGGDVGWSILGIRVFVCEREKTRNNDRLTILDTQYELIDWHYNTMLVFAPGAPTEAAQT